MPDTLQDIEQEFKSKFDGLESKVEEQNEALASAREEGDSDRIEEVSKSLGSLDDEVKKLQSERDDRLRTAEYDSLKGKVTTLEKALEQAREPQGDFTFLGGVPTEEQDEVFGRDKSFYSVAKKALEGSGTEAREAMEQWEEALVGKAMTEASGTTGGYLAPPQVLDELITLREQNNILRPLFSSVSVSTDTIRIAAQTKGLVAAWVAELAEKPASELAFGEQSVNVFTKAGLAIVSNQLLQDSNPSVDRLVNSDLARRLAALEEIAFIDGSGNGQPKGILNTEGVSTTEVTVTDIDATDGLLDKIVDAIVAVYTDYFDAPNAILMHPRTWGRIVKARNPDYAANYVVGPPRDRQVTDRLPGFGAGPNPTGSLFGLPVYTTRNVPINKGAADDQSRVIVGNFQEGLVLDHSGVTLDSSKHVYFTSNQTVFRAEDRVGFTAARYPKAFNVIGGVGLAGG